MKRWKTGFAATLLLVGAAHLAGGLPGVHEGRPGTAQGQDRQDRGEPLAAVSGGSRPAGEEAQPRRMLREGTSIDNQMGRFLGDAESAVFQTRDGLELTALPNLNLQRVLRVLKTLEDPDGVWWNVSGTVTEFGDRNFLLIRRAVYKAAAAPPPPEAVEPAGESDRGPEPRS
jgi:hypothetical protein